MKRTVPMLLCAAALVLVGACAPPPQEAEEPDAPEAPAHDPAADRETLSAKSDEWTTAFNAGDSAAIAAMMTEDGMVLPPNAEPVSGREAIEDFWQAFIDTGVGAGVRIKELMVDGDLAVKIGEYDILSPEGDVVDTGKWIEIWTRVDDGWMLHRDMFSSNNPPEPAAE